MPEQHNIVFHDEDPDACYYECSKCGLRNSWETAPCNPKKKQDSIAPDDPEDMNEEICWFCKWWVKQDWFEDCGIETAEAREAFCLRHAPIAVETTENKYMRILTIWPSTNGKERCGDFEKEVKI